MITHIMNDDENPPEALVWTMLCGEQCIAFDGKLVPELDFYGVEHGHKADCDACRGIHICHELTVSAVVPA